MEKYQESTERHRRRSRSRSGSSERRHKKHKKDKKEKKEKRDKKDKSHQKKHKSDHRDKHRRDHSNEKVGSYEEYRRRHQSDDSEDDRNGRPKMTFQEKAQIKREEKEAEYRRKIEERPLKPYEMKLQAPKDNPMMEVVCNDRLGGKVRVKCYPTDSISNLKLLISAHTGTRPEKIRLQKAHIIFKDHITVDDYEIKDGMQIEMYYN